MKTSPIKAFTDSLLHLTYLYLNLVELISDIDGTILCTLAISVFALSSPVAAVPRPLAVFVSVQYTISV